MVKDHLIVFVITTSIFLIGVFLGLYLSKLRISGMESKMDDFEKNMNSFEISLLIEDALRNKTLSCKFLDSKLGETRQQLYELGKKAIEYEEKPYTKDYGILKEQYNFVRAKYWLMLEKYKRWCNNNYTTILYFYKTKEPCQECRDQGVVLSYISQKHPDVFVVPLDKDENITIVNIIKEAFDINSAPTLIINSSRKIVGFVSENELNEILS